TTTRSSPAAWLATRKGPQTVSIPPSRPNPSGCSVVARTCARTSTARATCSARGARARSGRGRTTSASGACGPRPRRNVPARSSAFQPSVELVVPCEAVDATGRTPGEPIPRAAAGLPWLVRLRWGVLAAQAVTVATGSVLLGDGLPLSRDLALLAITLASNVL